MGVQHYYEAASVVEKYISSSRKMKVCSAQLTTKMKFFCTDSVMASVVSYVIIAGAEHHCEQ